YGVGGLHTAFLYVRVVSVSLLSVLATIYSNPPLTAPLQTRFVLVGVYFFTSSSVNAQVPAIATGTQHGWPAFVVSRQTPMSVRHLYRHCGLSSVPLVHQ